MFYFTCLNATSITLAELLKFRVNFCFGNDLYTLLSSCLPLLSMAYAPGTKKADYGPKVEQGTQGQSSSSLYEN